MNSTDSYETPAFAEFTSLLRRWLWLWAILVVGVTAAVVISSTVDNETLYKTEALVVATELTVRVDSFPGTATAIFEGGTVAELAADRAGTGIDPNDLIPDIATISPVDGTSVIRVRALHQDPNLAALYANASAEALVEELNRVGPGLGVFAVHAGASVPRSPVPNSVVEAAAQGIVIGSVLVYGLIALLAVVTSTRKSRAERAAWAASPTSEIVGIGKAFEDRLTSMGISDIQTLAGTSPEWLVATLDIRPELADDWVGQAVSRLGRDPRATPTPHTHGGAPPARD